MSRRRAALAAMVALLLGGCGAERVDVTGPGATPAPPSVTAVWPAPRASGVVTTVDEIWAELAQPLDPASVSERTVYLKIDDARTPVAVGYDPARRRISIRPREALRLLTVYTVELSTGLRTAEGGALESTWSWQFTTIGVRAPHSPEPASGATGASPVVLLRWAGRAGTPGGVSFEVYAGHDSAAVAARAMPPLRTTADTLLVPATRWRAAGPTYWSVRAIHATTREHIDAPVWRFDTLDPATAATATMTFLASESGWQNLASRNNRSCTGLTLTSGSSYNCALRWSVALLPAGVRIASARIELTATINYEGMPLTEPSLAGTLAAPNTCNLFDNPPPPDLANGQIGHAQPQSGTVVWFDSDALAAHVEASRRFSSFHGYMLRSQTQFVWHSHAASSDAVRPKLVVTYYP